MEATGHTALSQSLGQDGRLSSVSECQLNLLGHVESVHRQISGRMDLIERELDGKQHTTAWFPCFLDTVQYYKTKTKKKNKYFPILVSSEVNKFPLCQIPHKQGSNL